MKKFKLKRNQILGSPDAETDENLLDVFIEIPTVEAIADTHNQASIIIGRTGSGKSAVIKYLKSKCEHLTEINPEEMSLRFLSNSNILRYFKALDVNLVLFYKVLWKHVFIVELLKMYFKDDLLEKKGHVFSTLVNNIREKFGKRDPKKERALKYLESWTEDFWMETEYRVSTLEKTLTEKFAVALGIKVDQLSFNIQDSKEKGEKYILNAKHKAEKVIQDSQSQDLIHVIRIMEESFFVDHQKRFYLVIDDLDKEWIETTYRYELIGAMVEVIKEFRKSFDGVKIIISLRENLNEMVFSALENRGGQREKFKPLYANLEWQDEELKRLVDKRIKRLSENQLEINNAFKADRRNKKTGFKYVLERTYKRPRDIISFVNHAIENANNKTHFSSDILAKAEPLYSLDRFQALEDEWGENYGQFGSLCLFLNGIQNGFSLKSIPEDNFDDVYLDELNDLRLRGALRKAIIDWQKDRIQYVSFLKKVLFILYRIGIVGIKKDAVFATGFFYDREILIKPSDISNKCKFYVHPSLYSYFKVNTLEQLPEN